MDTLVGSTGNDLAMQLVPLLRGHLKKNAWVKGKKRPIHPPPPGWVKGKNRPIHPTCRASPPGWGWHRRHEPQMIKDSPGKLQLEISGSANWQVDGLLEGERSVWKAGGLGSWVFLGGILPFGGVVWVFFKESSWRSFWCFFLGLGRFFLKFSHFPHHSIRLPRTCLALWRGTLHLEHRHRRALFQSLPRLQ